MRKSVDQPWSSSQFAILLLAIVLCVTALWAIGCGGGGGSSYSGTPTTPSTPSGAIGTTVTITSTGLSSSDPRNALGERIRFTNSDSQIHQILTTPHLIHTDCPGLNSVGSLAPGGSGVSEPLTTARGCGFHDHLNPDAGNYRGQVLVGLSMSDPVPAEPNYLHR